MSRFSGQSLIESREGWLKELDKRISLLEEAGKIFAHAKEDYGVYLAKKLLELTNERAGVVRDEIAKGDVHIAEKRLHKDICKIKYDTALQVIYQCKIEIKIVESDIMHERVQR